MSVPSLVTHSKSALSDIVTAVFCDAGTRKTAILAQHHGF
jgi:hypothetical protein